MLNIKINFCFLILLVIFVKCFAIYLPKINEEQISSSYDTIKLPINEEQQQVQQQQQQQQQYHRRFQSPEHNINHLIEMINAIRSLKQQQFLQSQQFYELQRQEMFGGETEEEETEEQQQSSEEKSYDKINDVVEVDTQKNDVSAVAAEVTPPPPPTTTATESFSQNFSSNERKSRYKRQLSDLLIVPNTKWCGKGNLANGSYNVLGGAASADKCCRRHDNCSIFIPPLSNRYDMFNYLPYTLSHCNCDRRFHTCLKLANDEDSRTIGKLFFNMIQTNCFVLRHEKVCRQRASNGDCLVEETKQKAVIKRNKKF